MRRPLGDWPTGGIEFVEQCPVCGGRQRVLLYAGLTDRIFFVAPGAWDLHACEGCGSAYLDPRPTADSIHLAYEEYYTHQPPVSVPAEELRGMRRLKRVLANGYKNWKFGLNLKPSSALGVIVGLILPVQRAILDRQYRHLKRAPKDGGRVLDVGFGDGSFLENASSLGWSVVGTDVDPKVVENGKKRGLDVQLGTVECVQGPFDVITMCHVIEHLHDPMAVLRSCYDLLRPGGTLWLETPNIDAMGRREFGANWRGLEPPRHLVLFSRRSLEWALREVGFADVGDIRQPSAAEGMYASSTLIAQNRDPYEPTSLSFGLKAKIAVVKLIEGLHGSRKEMLALIARKPLLGPSGYARSTQPPPDAVD